MLAPGMEMGAEGMVQGYLSLPSHLNPVLTFPRGVGFSFLFSVPLILLVFVTFLVGGNVQTLVCRSWESGELYEVGLPCSGTQSGVETDVGRARGLEGSGSLRGQEGERQEE